MKLNEQIKEARKRAGLTQRKLADQIGWQYQQIQRIERTGVASTKTLQVLSNALSQAFYIYPENILK